MSSLRTIEIDGNLVGILTRDQTDRSFQFHSGVAPYDLLDGSRFAGLAEANEAIRRMSRAARQARSTANIQNGEAA